MQYLLMIYGAKPRMTAAPKEAITKMSAAYDAYTQAMKKAGVFVGGERLKPDRTPRPSASPTARPTFSTAPMPTPRSSSAATT